MIVRKTLLVVPVSSLLILLFALNACSGERKEAASSPEVVRGVSVTSAKRATVADYLDVVGTVRASQSSEIASQMMGNIVGARVHEGDRVTRGQVLVVIDDAQPRAAMDRAMAGQSAVRHEVMAAESDFRLAEVTFKRYQDLYEKKSVSPQEFDEVKARFQGAQARRDMSHAAEAQTEAALTQARTAQEYSRVRAPFDGVITQKKVDVGTLATPGMTLLTVEDPRRYRLEASVDESDVSMLRLGQVVPVRIDALDSVLGGKISQIVPAADAATRSFLVKIELRAGEHLHSGLFGRAQISRGKKNVILVPRSALVHRGQLQAVYVVDAAQTAELRYITLGNTAGDQVEVLSGLDGNEKLVSTPGSQELSGEKIGAKP